MSYVFVDGFAAGLDVRKSRVAGVPGSLNRLINAHINRGGEIEGRKAIVPRHSLPDSTFGMHSVNADLFVFGSAPEPALPTGVKYQQLQHPDGITAMSRILSTENFDGRIYAIAQFIDSNIYHYYNGQRVTTWDGIAANVPSNAGVASALAAQIDSNDKYVATVAGNEVTITANTPGTPFTISATTVNFGATNDQAIALAELQANVVAVLEARAQATFNVTGGSAGAGNNISSIKIDGQEVLGATVLWATSNSNLATLVATQINTNVSTPEYTAEASGVTVTIKAQTGVGAAANGFVLAVTVNGTVTVGSVFNMSGGVTAVTAAAQQYKATITGTYERADQYTITLDGSAFTISGANAGIGTTALTFKNKLYSTLNSLVYFSEIDNPTRFGTNTNGANFINMSNSDSGSETLTALERYQGNLAVFARRSVQVWFVDQDETKNTQLQVLPNTGTISPRAVLSYGNNDTFYLADSGVRSLRARDSSNAAYVFDVGTAIDPMIKEYRLSLGEDIVSQAVAVMEPEDDRFWLALGTRIFVFSYFPGAKISAWSYYELGFQVTEFARVDSKIYLRSGNTIYLYGGEDGDTYPAPDEAPISVYLPFLDAGKPATVKNLIGVDAALVGVWKISIAVDPDNESRKVEFGTTHGISYAKLRGTVVGETTHFAPEFVCTAGGQAKIISTAVHYQDPNEDG